MKRCHNHFKGNTGFPRLRIGIGRPPGKMDPAPFVLRRFTKQERQEFSFTLQDGIQALRILLLKGFDKTASFVNSEKKWTKQVEEYLIEFFFFLHVQSILIPI
ncbi:hypothetical protein V8G54_015504 [Vigna mungo]|uniref:Uncharacterized protein n=1 Tax=Vigna mungo TaxID=3915 RepID=A0AAQ3RWW7_VIGMU